MSPLLNLSSLSVLTSLPFSSLLISSLLNNISSPVDVQRAAVLAVQALMEAVRDSPDSGYGECPICLEIMEKPFSTECDHTFCYECIVGLINSNNRSTAGCPMCRRTLTIKNIRPAPQLIAPTPAPLPALALAPDPALAQLKAAGGTEGVEVAGVSALMDVLSDDVTSDDLNTKAVGDAVAPGAAGSVAVAGAIEVTGGVAGGVEGEGGVDEVAAAAEEEPLNILGDGLMTTKLRHLVSELRKVQTADSTAKCLVFSQFTQVLKHCMVMGKHTLL